MAKGPLSDHSVVVSLPESPGPASVPVPGTVTPSPEPSVSLSYSAPAHFMLYPKLDKFLAQEI